MFVFENHTVCENSSKNMCCASSNHQDVDYNKWFNYGASWDDHVQLPYNGIHNLLCKIMQIKLVILLYTLHTVATVCHYMHPISIFMHTKNKQTIRDTTWLVKTLNILIFGLVMLTSVWFVLRSVIFQRVQTQSKMSKKFGTNRTRYNLTRLPGTCALTVSRPCWLHTYEFGLGLNMLFSSKYRLMSLVWGKLVKKTLF